MLKRWLYLCRQLTFKAPPTPSERLAATLRPDPEYLDRRKRAKANWKLHKASRWREQFMRDPLIKAVLADSGQKLYSRDMKKIRKKILRRDGPECCFCGGPVQVENHTDEKTYGSIEHVVPRFLGGSYGVNNLKLAHIKCNRHSARRFTDIAVRVRSIADSMKAAGL